MTNKTPDGKTILKLDASALIQSACSLRLKYTVIDGYRELANWNDTLYGSAFHSFPAKMAETKGDIAVALKEAKRIFSLPNEIRSGKKHLNDLHLTKTCLDYWEHFEKTDDFEILLTEDGKPCVEIYFENKVYEDDTLVIYLCGTIDKIGKFKNGCYAIGDYKTHSLMGAAKYSIPAFFQRYQLSTQALFYLHNIYLKASLNPSSILATVCQYPLGIFFDGVFLSTSQATVFERSEVFIPKDALRVEFALLLDREIVKLIHIFNNQSSVKREGMINGACVDGKYLCKFLPACSAPDERCRDHVLKNSFKQKPYNPQNHGKE